MASVLTGCHPFLLHILFSLSFVCYVKDSQNTTTEKDGSYDNECTLHKEAFRKEEDDWVFVRGENPVIITEHDFVEDNKGMVKVNGTGTCHDERKYTYDNRRGN